MDQWVGIILAAGRGVRMRSRIPRVLHPICGKEMVLYSIEKLLNLGLQRVILVVSPDNIDSIRQVVGDIVEYVIQTEPNGTGSAVQDAMRVVGDNYSHILVHNADMPLLSYESLHSLTESHKESGYAMTLLTMADVVSEDLGCILRDEQQGICDVIESIDRSLPDCDAFEVNLGTYCFQAKWLVNELTNVMPRDAGELYLTDLVRIGYKHNGLIGSVCAGDPVECLGVNNRVQLSNVETVQRRRIVERLMLSGVTIQNPETVIIDDSVNVGQDTTILPNTILTGNTDIGEQCYIGPWSMINDCTVGNSCTVNSSQLEDSILKDNVEIGPFSHLRSGCVLETNTHIGNYVEMKETTFGNGSACGHFSYLGDANISEDVNIGAGTVTCNYDGIEKHQTLIGQGALIGCDTMLVAPVIVGKGASTGAGSVVVTNIPDGRLAVGVPARIVDQSNN
ncbi:MAG: bifunctional UDP-N-acetylglucosamine diphosphorylase/glucosamine-1-phosphate N-acetyltransferase GlmU [Chloroflexota bacterium]|nr:bifunctional UDP-N-acetylglucosamine diphosphorylase/glucosamine-1-phosphate N-acetyltransferase GlmU [Chloroflexota bacterium]